MSEQTNVGLKIIVSEDNDPWQQHKLTIVVERVR